MSLSELMVVIVVALLVTKPEDIPTILKKVKQLRDYIISIKQDVWNAVSQEVLEKDTESDEDVEEINFYLQKVISLQGAYEGGYDLKSIKEKYRQLMQHKTKNKP